MPLRNYLRAFVLALTAVGAGACASTDSLDERSTGAPVLDDVTGIVVKPGFAVRTGVDGRPWVFTAGSEDLASFDRGEEPAKNATVFVDGVAIRSTEKGTIRAYAASREGFVVRCAPDEVLWVFEEGSDELRAFDRGEESSQSATLFVDGKPLRSVEMATLRAYAAARPGFVSREGADGYTWIFRAGSEEVAAFDRGEEPSKSATLFVGGKPFRSTDLETLRDYEASVPGFVLRQGGDGFTWVFRVGSAALAEFDRGGEPAESATIFVGGKPFRSVELSDLQAYAAARG